MPEPAPVRVLKVPSAVYYLSLAPLAFFAMGLFLALAVKFFYGYGFEDGMGSVLRVIAPPALPGGAMGLLHLLGRLEPVDSLPMPQDPGPPVPGRLALPEAGSAPAPMRPERLPARPKRLALDGLLTWGGAATTALAFLVAFVQQDSFDAVLGVKLGGVWWHGAYWNRWWFVFYGLLFSGLGLMAAGLLGFTRRLNRREE
ncbi:MAG: hypothetical protein HY928_05490 [Elusimicrobia bacterium]|nr:hypothetical protein [Elusimicrobiota bacterium]